MNGKFLFLGLFSGVLSIIGYSDNTPGLGTLFMFLGVIFIAMAMAFKKEPKKKAHIPDIKMQPAKATENTMEDKNTSPQAPAIETEQKQPILKPNVYRKPPVNNDSIKCPKCGSTQISANRKGFGAGKAVGGAILTGGIGLLGGFIGSRKMLLTCLNCGKQWQPGKGR